jgi:hypothetical protein
LPPKEDLAEIAVGIQLRTLSERYAPLVGGGALNRCAGRGGRTKCSDRTSG